MGNTRFYITIGNTNLMNQFTVLCDIRILGQTAQDINRTARYIFIFRTIAK